MNHNLSKILQTARTLKIIGQRKIHLVCSEPNMVVEIEGVKTKKNTLNSFQKYRKLRKTIFKSLFAGLEFKELTLTEIQKHEKKFIWLLRKHIWQGQI